jgi:hypothetical protein
MTFDKEKLVPLYQMEIGKAGESQAFYIASKLGMPSGMIERAALEAYGEDYDIGTIDGVKENISIYSNSSAKREDNFRKNASNLKRRKKTIAKKKIDYHLGDSVMVYPDKKIGIICKEANEKGVLQVMLPDKKIWINHKRVKLQVAASELYPEDYDFSIIFDSVETRKARHDMGRKHTEGMMLEVDED